VSSLSVVICPALYTLSLLSGLLCAWNQNTTGICAAGSFANAGSVDCKLCTAGKYTTFEMNERRVWDYGGYTEENVGTCSYCGSYTGTDNEGVRCLGSQIGIGCQANGMVTDDSRCAAGGCLPGYRKVLGDNR
jgi:hypothetical protein